MDILIIFKGISFLLSLLIILYSLKVISIPKVKMFFVLMIFSFFLSTILFFPEGRINDWLKHGPFFLGQIFLYFFLDSLMSQYSKQESLPTQSNPPQTPTTPVVAAGGVAEWFSFMTDQGIQHFLPVPVFFIIMGFIRVHYQHLQNASVRAVLNLCLASGACLTMIHLGEFVVESQGWLPFLEGNPIEIIEFLWYYAAVILFWITLKKLPTLHTANHD